MSADRPKLPRAKTRIAPTPPPGAAVRKVGAARPTDGDRLPETPDARRARLRRIASGGR